MKSLAEAWKWYQDTKKYLGVIKRLGERYWNHLDWEGPLGKDDKLKEIDAREIVDGTTNSLAHLDDLAVLVLFSVFESLVRERILLDIQNQRGAIDNAHLLHIIDDALDGIEKGSFSRILELFKGLNPNLVEDVNQVLRYRNWVAHGKRTAQPAYVAPDVAHDRLRRFLESLDVRTS
jgi:hypothetical protein